jgi:2-dehydro-3-deoxyphosphogluconate aldolase/(4S)-4-hydroxy-2-oxoglutarate aldolase
MQCIPRNANSILEVRADEYTFDLYQSIQRVYPLECRYLLFSITCLPNKADEPVAIYLSTSENRGMSREKHLQRVIDCGIVAVVRFSDPGPLVSVVKALADGGVTVAEVTLTVPNALDVIREAKQQLGDRVLLGAGTVLDPETARAAILAGAEFIVAPSLNLEVIKLCRRYDKLVMPGAFTPTEVVTAWEAGADIVKVFPAEIVGPAFFKAMRGPLPQVKLMPTGGVDTTTAAEFLKAGAVCLGIGSQLVEPKAVASGDLARITQLAKQYVEIVRQHRMG